MPTGKHTEKYPTAAQPASNAWLAHLAAVPVRLPADGAEFDPLTAANFARLAARAYSPHEADGGTELSRLLAPAGPAVVETFAWLPPDDGPVRG